MKIHEFQAKQLLGEFGLAKGRATLFGAGTLFGLGLFLALDSEPRIAQIEPALLEAPLETPAPAAGREAAPEPPVA